MSSGLSCCRWTALLTLVVIGCGQQSDELILEPPQHLETTGSPDQWLVQPVPTSSISVPGTMSTVQQITTEFAELINARVQCGRRPSTCPVNQLTAPESKYRRYLTTLMEIRVNANLATRSGSGEFRFRIESIDFISPFVAVVHTCIFDSLVVFDSGQSNSIRDDIVFDDDVISGRTAWHVVVDDGKWKWSDATSIDMSYGKDICGFTS